MLDEFLERITQVPADVHTLYFNRSKIGYPSFAVVTNYHIVDVACRLSAGIC